MKASDCGHQIIVILGVSVAFMSSLVILKGTLRDKKI